MIQSSAEPARALSESQTVQDSEDESQIFTYRELATATNNFREESIIGRGGFGCVYKGTLESTGQEVAVKMLDHSGVQGEREFIVEVLMLSLLRHENLVRLIGYCAEGDQRLLVYEYMPLGSVEDHMHNKKCSGQKALDWSTRMQIAAGAAKGIEHLHNVADPPVIFRDLKTANILLDHGFKPKLSDFGLAKFGPTGDVTHVTTKVMGTLGYCAPDYAKSGKLTIKSDIYSFGVVMLELITGRKAIMDSSMGPDCFLGDWAVALFKKDNIREIVDPVLTIKGRYMESTMRKALEVAFMCLREEANARPTISEVGIALNYIVKCTTSKKKKARAGKKKGGTSSSSPETPRILNGNNEERNVDLDRQRAVAEAKNWAESLRRKSTEPSSSHS
ncbi:unnamed protein product [Arabis nemorensis]|uniref:Protein kinase domain-containing protein n=1 Tax=Arabis nemorensis TaxID=586526 RepID=A0A565CKJ7_9BRAS|nr:unnamed protein product [Arabis nemorensis]